MSSRNSARRHRGRNPMTPRAPRAPRPDAKLAALEQACLDQGTRDTITYWREALDRPLFVYFIQEEDGGPVKIGQANDPVARLRELQCGNPRRLVIRAVVLAAVDTEASLHVSWGEVAHVRGEWFGGDETATILRLAADASRAQIADHKARVTPIDRLAARVSSQITPYAGTWTR